MKYLGIRKGASGLLFSAIPGPFQEGQQLAEGSSSTKSSDTGLISKELQKELAKEGIPSEVRRLYNRMADLELKMSLGIPVNRREIYSLQAEINKVIQQSKELNAAIKIAEDNGSIDDIAVNLRGAMFALDEKGKIVQVPFAKFDYEKYTPLTVGELINARKNDDSFIDDQGVTNIIRSSVGIEKINDYILKIINTVGSAENSREAYQDLVGIVGHAAKEPTSTLFNAIQGIQNEFKLLGASAIFKVAESSKDRNIKDAFQYIISMLPKNMHSLLIGNYLGHGGQYEHSEDFVLNVVKTALLSANDSKYSYKIDYDQLMNKAAGNTPDSTKAKQHSLTMMEQFFNGDLNNTMILLSDPNYDNKTAIEVPGTVIPGLTTDKNQARSNAPMSIALEGEGMGKYLDYSKMYMGYQKIPEGMLHNIVYTNDQVANVWLPVDENDNIDFRQLSNYSGAEKEIASRGVIDVSEKNKIHINHGSAARYDLNGNLIMAYSGRMKQFLMTHGYTLDDHVDSNNTFVKELLGSDANYIENTIDLIYKQYKKAGIKMDDKWDLDWNDDIVLVPIFIKIQDNAATNAATYAGYGSLVNTSTLENTMVRQNQTGDFTASGAELYD